MGGPCAFRERPSSASSGCWRSGQGHPPCRARRTRQPVGRGPGNGRLQGAGGRARPQERSPHLVRRVGVRDALVDEPVPTGPATVERSGVHTALLSPPRSWVATRQGREWRTWISITARPYRGGMTSCPGPLIRVGRRGAWVGHDGDTCGAMVFMDTRPAQPRGRTSRIVGLSNTVIPAIGRATISFRHRVPSSSSGVASWFPQAFPALAGPASHQFRLY